jgi:hypothetical protein
MILGNAKGYTKMVMARVREIGYRPQLFLLNGDYIVNRLCYVFSCAWRACDYY